MKLAPQKSLYLIKQLFLYGASFYKAQTIKMISRFLKKSFFVPNQEQGLTEMFSTTPIISIYSGGLNTERVQNSDG